MHVILEAVVAWMDTPLPEANAWFRSLTRVGVFLLIFVYAVAFFRSAIRKGWKVFLNVLTILVMLVYYGAKLYDQNPDGVTNGAVFFNVGIFLLFLSLAANLGEVAWVRSRENTEDSR